jgi:hypothetical protein
MANLANNNNNNNNQRLLNEEPESVHGFNLQQHQTFGILQVLRNDDIDAPQGGPLTSLPSPFVISRPMHYNDGYKPGIGFSAHFRTIKAIVPWAALCVCESFEQVPRLRNSNGDISTDRRSIFNFMKIAIITECMLVLQLLPHPLAIGRYRLVDTICQEA